MMNDDQSHSVESDSLQPHGLSVHGILQARILEWVAFPFSSGSSRSRNQTRVSCIAGGFFTNWAIREATVSIPLLKKWEKVTYVETGLIKAPL